MNTTIRSWSKTRLAAAMFVLMFVLVSALTPMVVSGEEQVINKGYASTDSGIMVGMAVASSIGSDEQSSAVIIERATTGNEDRYLGVVTSVANSAVSLTDKDNVVPVTTTGKTNLYVSDINGEINNGDKLTLSPLAGILMKATADSKVIVGIATGKTTGKATSRTIRLDTGTKQVSVYMHGALLDKEVRDWKTGGSDKPFLLLAGESITGKEVSMVQVVAAMAIALFTFVFIGSVIYSNVRNSTIAIGRNPLSKVSIFRQMSRVFILSALILIFGLASVVIILWI